MDHLFSLLAAIAVVLLLCLLFARPIWASATNRWRRTRRGLVFGFLGLSALGMAACNTTATATLTNAELAALSTANATYVAIHDGLVVWTAVDPTKVGAAGAVEQTAWNDLVKAHQLYKAAAPATAIIAALAGAITAYQQATGITLVVPSS